MRKDLLAARHLIKVEQIKSEMQKYSSLTEWAKDVGKTKQCIFILLEKYGLLDYWRENHSKQYHGIYDHLCTYKGKSITKLYFVNNTKKAFYYLSKNTKGNIHSMMSDLKRNAFNSKNFQAAFNMHGYDALRCEIVVRGKDATKEKLIDCIRSDDCYNTKKFLSDTEKKDNYKNNYIRGNNDHREKTVLLPRPTITTVGVTWNFRAQKYVAQPRVNGRQTYLGYFKTEKEAGDAIKKAVNNG